MIYIYKKNNQLSKKNSFWKIFKIRKIKVIYYLIIFLKIDESIDSP